MITRINEDFLDDLNINSVDLSTEQINADDQDAVYAELTSGKYYTFLRFEMMFPGESVLTEKETENIIRKFYLSFKRFVKMCPYIDACSNVLLCSGDKLFSDWNPIMCEEYDAAGLIGFKASPTMRKKDLMLFIESIWKIARNVFNNKNPYDLYHIAAGFEFLILEGKRLSVIGKNIDVASPCFSKERIYLDLIRDGHLKKFDDIIELSYAILDQDMTLEEQAELCRWAINRHNDMSKRLSLLDRLKRISDTMPEFKKDVQERFLFEINKGNAF